MNEITGSEAIARMRQMRHDKNSHFTLHHLTWNDEKQESKGMRVVERCRLRPALPDDKFKRDADLYLPYVNLDLDQPRLCFKKLVRIVAFPPGFEQLKVNWFTT